jgi:Tol biopolymer transport system component
MISDDNQKIVFTRHSPGDGYSNFYSVNADGSGEREIVTEQWLNSLEDGTRAFFPVFAPKSHQLVFNTRLCESQDYNALCVVGVFLVDADTGEIRKIVHPDKAGQYDRDGNFKVSPNGKIISVASSGHIDIFDINGKAVRENVLPYTPSTPTELFPDQYWLPGSDGIIAALPNEIHFGWAYPSIPSYSVWRYALLENTATQIPLEPPPGLVSSTCGDIANLSPDGNWLLYVGFEETNRSHLLYLKNLVNGHAQPYQGYACPRRPYQPWSPDSKYFVFGYYIAAVGQMPIFANPISSSFAEWIDDTHYTYLASIDNIPKILMVEIRGETVLTYDLGYWYIKSKPR